MNIVRHMLLTALLLGLFALIGTGMVAMTHEETAERIAKNEREALLRSLHELVPPAMHDNDISRDVIMVRDRKLLGSSKPVAIYRARKDQRPVAAIIAAVAPDGYNGDIRLLVAIDYSGVLLGVRVLSHRETPGLGDSIDLEKSDWLLDFNGHSLDSTDELGWRVVKDGGIFDQFTGATITPRAVVKAVHNSLKYFERHRDELFKRPGSGTDETAQDTAGHSDSDTKEGASDHGEH